jgi:hypothetical protein
VFTGNGDYGNPEREALVMLWNSRGDGDYTIHFSYDMVEIDKKRQEDWIKQQKREKSSKKADKSVRADWSHPQHSLEAFFDAHKNLREKVRIVKEDPYVINLLDEVGF